MVTHLHGRCPTSEFSSTAALITCFSIRAHASGHNPVFRGLWSLLEKFKNLTFLHRLLEYHNCRFSENQSWARMIDREMRGSHERCEKKVPFLALLDSLTRFVFDGKKKRKWSVCKCIQSLYVCVNWKVLLCIFGFCLHFVVIANENNSKLIDDYWW